MDCSFLAVASADSDSEVHFFVDRLGERELMMAFGSKAKNGSKEIFSEKPSVAIMTATMFGGIGRYDCSIRDIPIAS